MANQKEICVAKFEGIRWKMVSGIMQGQKDIRRKPFGEFTVFIKINAKNGRTSVCVKCWDFAELDKSEMECDDFNGAIFMVSKYFKEIFEITKNMPNSAIQRAEKAYRQEIAKTVSEIRREKQ